MSFLGTPHLGDLKEILDPFLDTPGGVGGTPGGGRGGWTPRGRGDPIFNDLKPFLTPQGVLWGMGGYPPLETPNFWG